MKMGIYEYGFRAARKDMTFLLVSNPQVKMKQVIACMAP
jgi:hypothetical protein